MEYLKVDFRLPLSIEREHQKKRERGEEGVLLVLMCTLSTVPVNIHGFSYVRKIYMSKVVIVKFLSCDFIFYLVRSNVSSFQYDIEKFLKPNKIKEVTGFSKFWFT